MDNWAYKEIGTHLSDQVTVDPSLASAIGKKLVKSFWVL